MNNDLEIFRAKLNKLSDNANERTLYPLICEYIQSCTSKYLGGPYIATSEESLSAEDKHIGFPDITVRRNNSRLVGWWEIKLPSDKLDKDSFNEQFTKYKDSLENILFTNLREWQLWQWDADGKPQLVDEIMFNVSSFGIGEEKKLENFLIKFFEGRPFEARTPKQLALALARKTRLLSKQVEEAYDEEDKDSDLVKLKSTFERTLIQNISVHQFANMIAETLAYSLFLAFLEHIHRGNGSKITLQTAIEYLPTNVPVLKDLYELINKVSSTIPVIYKASLALLEQLEASDIGRIYQKLVEHKPGEDPVIQFYEPFLKEYDPKEREARGVYYTPKPVVDYIVRSVDWILRNKFGKEKGLAEESVQLLDPATGTGTFLMSAIQQIHQNIKVANSALGDEMVKKEFNRVVLNHILKHFYGFELLIAPYAIAHLKLTLEIERLGFNFKFTENDNEPDNDRFKVYLANTLDNPDQPPQDFFGFNSIPQESESARKVKKDVPIIAIIGNPPYSGHSENTGQYATSIVKEAYYSVGNEKLKESNTKWLLNDYVKFIRFSQKKIEHLGYGLIGMITSNSYIDSPIFRGMRQNLLNSFKEIYMFNLHGNSKKKEVLPKGITKDENVFNITEGVCIAFFIKQFNSDTDNKTYYDDLWGRKQEKFDKLLNIDISSQSWKTIKPYHPKYLFIPQDEVRTDEYTTFISIQDIFKEKSLGILTKRDNLAIGHTSEEILSRLNLFTDDNQSDQLIADKFKLPIKDKDRWDISKTRAYLKNNLSKESIIKINYRPFDERFIYYDEYIVARKNVRIMHNLNKNNLALVTTRQLANVSFTHAFVSSKITEQCYISNKTKEGGYVFPLYLYPENQHNNLSLLDNSSSEININQDFILYIKKLLKMEFESSGMGNLVTTIGPESVFYYIYGILFSPSYRKRYAEQLRDEFPRICFTQDINVYKRIVDLGKRLVNLHLLGNNPFVSSFDMFSDKNKNLWGLKIGGTPPPNAEDWSISDIRYAEVGRRIYINNTQYFDDVDKEIWDFEIGSYRVCEKWLKDMKKTKRSLSIDNIQHYLKICVSLRETINVMKEIDQAIPSWPIK